VAAEPAPVAGEKRVVAVRRGEVSGHWHITGFKLADGSTEDAEDVIAAIKGGAVYTMIPPPGAPAHPAYVQHQRPLLIQVTQCPDCNADALFA
jgi:uncharacterized protein YbjT (DUF2867 family)